MKNNLSLAFTVSESSVKTACVLSILGCGTEVNIMKASTLHGACIFMLNSVCRSRSVCGTG